MLPRPFMLQNPFRPKTAEPSRPSKMRLAAFALGCVFLPVLFSSSSFASDGVIELNQTCAINGECVRGDDPGFPITITGGDGSSYLLTSDLIIGDPNLSGIVIDSSAAGISLDLNGFTIRGVTSCTGTAQDLTCSPTGVGRGIQSSAVWTKIRNGHVVGMGSSGVFVIAGSLIEGVTASENGGWGIFTGFRSVISRSTSHRNGSHGFHVGVGSAVSDSSSSINGGDGYSLSTNAQAYRNVARANGGSGFRSIFSSNINIQGNTASINGGHGIDVGARSVIRNNTISGSELTGISAGTGSVIEGNTVGVSAGIGIAALETTVINNNSVRGSGEGGILAGEGSSISGNSVAENGTAGNHDGIHCTLGCRVHGNTIRSNTGVGLRFNSNSSGYSGNIIGANGGGTVVLGRDTGANVCGTSTTCP